MLVYILLGSFLVILYFFNLTHMFSKKNKRQYLDFINKILIISTFIFLFLLSFFRAPNVGTDYHLYYKFFKNGYYKDYFDPFINNIFDIAIYFDEFRIVTFVSTLIFLSVFFFLKEKYSYNGVIFTVMFVLSFLYFFFLNGLRQALAMSILWIGVMALQKNNLKGILLFTFVIIIASQFHISAYLTILFLLIPKLRVNTSILIGALFIVTIGFFTGFIRENLDIFLLSIDYYKNKYINNLDYFFSINKEKGLIQFFPILIQYIFFLIWLKFTRKKNIKSNKFIESYYFFYLLFYAASGVEAIDRFQLYLYPSIVFFYDMLVFNFIKYSKTKRELIIAWLFCSLIILFWFMYFILRLWQNTHDIVPYSLW